jgi:phage recombination protein Bet
MSNELTIETSITDLETVWQKADIIRRTFAPTLTQPEFAMFVGLGKSLGANPFNREIWAVKYGNNPAQIFLGRDFYRRKAQEEPDYRGHQVDVVYSNDVYKVINGMPQHSYNLKDRGKLVGAYCVVYRRGCEPYPVFCEFQEYFAGGNAKPNLWDKKPATMIKKVAEAQGLRGAFQGTFKGTYDESEAIEIQPETAEESRVKSFIDKAQTPADIEILYDTVPEKYHDLLDQRKEQMEATDV